MPFDYEHESSRLGVRLVGADEFASYTRQFVTQSRNLSSTLYDVPTEEMQRYYQRPGSRAILNTSTDRLEELREIQSFASQSNSVIGYPHSRLHFKSHVAEIEGRLQAYVPTGNLSTTALSDRQIPRSEYARRREVGSAKDAYQINLGLEITNPEIIREVQQIQGSLSRGHFVQRTRHFASGGSAAEDLSVQLRRAGKGDEVVLVSPYLDNMAVVRDIARASAAGARVTVIAAPGQKARDNPRTEQSRQQAREFLAAAGVNVYTADESLLVHAKYAAIQGKGNAGYVQLGSSNYTTASIENRTLDYMFLANDPTLAAQLIAQTRQIEEEYGLKAVTKSSALTINKYDLGPLGALYRPAFQERGRLSTTYDRALGTETKRFGALPYYPTSMPAEYFQMFQGRALPQVTIYQNVYEAFTRQEAPQALKAMDAQLSDPGLGEKLNRLFGVNLYEPGAGLGITALKGVGRLLDTVFGHYGYQDYRRYEKGMTRGSLAKLDESYYMNSEPAPGFFEQSFSFVGETFKAVGLSLASYFAITHAWNVTRSLIQDTGADYLFDPMAKEPLVRFARTQYTTPIASQVVGRAELVDKVARSNMPESLVANYYLEGLSDELRVSRAVHGVLESLRDYSIISPDGQMREITPAVMDKIRTMDLFNYSQLDALANDATFLEKARAAGFNLDELKTEHLVKHYIRTFATAGDIDSPIYSSMVRKMVKPESMTWLSAFDLTMDDYIHATPAFMNALNPNMIDAIKQRQSRALGDIGVDVKSGRIEMRQIDLDTPTFGGLFGMMAGSRQAERAMFDSVTRPMLEYVAVVGSDQQANFRKALSNISKEISAPPSLEFVRQVGEGTDAYFEYTKLSPVQYGYRRMEAMAEAYENIAYFIPSNLLLWFKPVRDLLGVRSIAVAGSGEAPPAGSLNAAQRAAHTKDLHERLAGQSLKGLIGSGFKGLVAAQTAVARKIQDFARNPKASFQAAYNLLSDDYQLRVIEGRLRSSMQGVLSKAAEESFMTATAVEQQFNKNNNVVGALREVTESLYESSRNVEGELIAKLHLRHRSLTLAHLKDKPRLAISGLKAARDRRFGDARRATSELFNLQVFEEVDLGQKYVDLIQRQERLAKQVERVDAISEVPTAKSAPFQMFRRFMMGTGLFFAADYLIDRFFLQTPGADLITQLMADAQLQDEDGDRVAQMRFDGRMPAYVKYPMAIAGFAAGGIIFGETALKETVVADAFKAMRPSTQLKDRLIVGSRGSAVPKELMEKATAPMLANLLDNVPTNRVSRRFGMTGAVAGMAASLFASQTIFSTVAHVANNIGGRYKDGLSIGGLYAQFSTTLMNATAEAIESRATAPTTRMEQADILMATMLAGEYQRSGSPAPSRGIYSYAYQLTTPMFQLALVQRHEASTGITTIGAGFQFLPILGMGTTPALPLSFKIRSKVDPSKGNAYETIKRLKDTGIQVSPEAEALAQQAAPPNAFMQIVNYLATGGFGDSLAYNPKSSLTQSLMFLGSTGLLLESARHIGKRLPNSLAREVKQMGVFADVPYHGTRMLNRLVEFSQIPLFIIPDTLSKGIKAFGQTGPTYSAGLKGSGQIVGAALAFFAAGQVARQVIGSAAEAIAGLTGNSEATLTSGFQTGINMAAFPVALGAAIAAHRGLGALQPTSKLMTKMPGFVRRATPYYISYLVTRAIVAPDSQITAGMENPAVEAYATMSVAGSFGFMLDRAGVFRRYDDAQMVRLVKDPIFGSQARRLRAAVIPAAADSGMRSAVQNAKQAARMEVAMSLSSQAPDQAVFDSAARARVREIYRSQLDDILKGSTHSVPLLKSIGARMGLAARVIFGAKLAATVITALAPNPLRQHPLMAPFRVVSGVEAYQDEAQPSRDPLALMLGKYRPKNMREAFGTMLDFVGQSLTFGRYSPGQAMGLFKDQPNMFVPLLAGAGVTVGDKDQLRNYTQAQGASVDVSLAVYTMFRGELSKDLAFRLQSVLSSDASNAKNLSQLLSYYRGSFARQDPAKTSAFLVGSQTDAAKGSRVLMMAQRVRSLVMTNLANQRPSEIAFDFMRMMVAAGYASDDNVDLKRVEGLPINYLGSLLFMSDTGSTNNSKVGLVKSILGGGEAPNLTEYIVTNALSENVQLGDRVPIMGDFMEAFAIARYAQASPDPSAQFMHAVTLASIAVPSALMLGMTGAELSAAFVAMSKGGSQNIARRELEDTLSRVRGRYIYNHKLRQQGSRHRFSTGLAGFVDVQVAAVQSQQERARELFFVMERQDSTRAARIDVRGLDMGEGGNQKLAALFNRQYLGNRETLGVLSAIDSFISDETGADVHAYITTHRNARKAAEQLYQDFTSYVFSRLDEGIANTDVSLVKVFGFDNYDHLLGTIMDRKSFVDQVAYLYDPTDLLRTQQYKPGDLVERSVFVRKYLASQAEMAIEKLEGSLPHYSQSQIEDLIGQPGALTQLRHQLNHAPLESKAESVTAIRRNADEVMQSSAAELIRKQGVVATLRDTVTGLGSAFLKLTQLSEVFSMAEAISMLGSDKLVERRMASYAVSTYAIELPMVLGGLAALQFAMANPLVAIGVAAIGIGIYAHATSHPDGVFSRIGNALGRFERGVVDRLASMTYAVTSMPVVQPVLATLTAPLRAVLHDVIAPTFTSMRLSARENRVLGYLTEFFVPETLDTFVDRPRFASEGYTYTGPIQELYTPSEIRRATRNRLANRRARLTSLDASPEDELLHPFLSGGASGYRERLMQQKYFSGTTLSAFSSGSAYNLSESLSLAISRRQAILDMTVYGRYTQRSDETFPGLGGELALMNAAFKANRVGGGSPFALNKVIEEMRAAFGTPIFRGLGKVFSLMLDYTDVLKNKAMDLLDFRTSNPKGDIGERIFKSLSAVSGRVVSGIYNNLQKDAPKLASMISGVYNRGMWQVLKTMGPKGFVMNTLGAAAELARLGGKTLLSAVRATAPGRALVHQMGGFFTPTVNLLANRDSRLMNIVHRFRKPTAGDYVKGSVGVMIGSSIGSSLGAMLGGETFGQLGAVAGTFVGAALGTALMYPVSASKGLADLVSAGEEAFSRLPRIRLPERFNAVAGPAPAVRPGPSYLSLQPIGQIFDRFAVKVESLSQKVSAIRSSASTRVRQLSAEAMRRTMSYTAGSRRIAAKLAPAVVDGLPAVVDLANLTSTGIRVLTLKGTDARRDYDAAYKGFAEAAVTIGAASLGATVMRGRFAPLKIIALAAVAKELFGKPLGERLSELAYSGLLESNEGKRFYARRKQQGLRSVDVIAGVAGTVALGAIGAEFLTTDTGRKGVGYLARQLSRTPQGAAVVMRSAQTAEGLLATYTRGRSAVTSLIPTRVAANPSAAVTSSVAASAAPTARSAGRMAPLLGKVGSLAGRATNLIGYGLMFALPVMAGFGQLSALSRMTGEDYNRRDVREDFKDIFASPMREGLGLLGGALGSSFGPIGTIIGGIGGSILGDVIGQAMSERNYRRAYEAGQTSKGDLKALGRATGIGAGIGVVGGIAAGAGILLAAGATLAALPLLASVALGAMVIGGTALVGSAIGAQLGFDTELSRRTSRERPAERGGRGRGRSTPATTNYRDLLRGSRQVATRSSPAKDKPSTARRHRPATRSITQVRKQQESAEPINLTTQSSSSLRALPALRKVAPEPDQVRSEQQRRVSSLDSLRPRRAQQSYDSGLSASQLRKTEAPEPWWKHLLEAPARMLDAIKDAAAGLFKTVKDIFSGFGDLLKKAAEAVVGGPAQAATAGNPLVAKIDQRLTSSNAALYAAVGLEAPTSGAGDLNLTASEQDLLKRLMAAENSNSAFDMAIAGRSVINRVAIARVHGAGMYNSNSASVNDIIYGHLQYEPTRNGAIDRTPSGSQATYAQEALSNLNNIDWWYQQGAARGLSRAQVEELYRNTSFKVPGVPGSEVYSYGGGQAIVTGGHVIGRLSGDASIPVPDLASVGLVRAAPRPSNSNPSTTGDISVGSLVNILRGDMQVVGQTAEGIRQQQASAGAVSGGAFATGLYTGPSHQIGGSSAYHVDMRFMSGTLTTQQMIAAVDAVAAGYRARGRNMEFSNSGVAGEIWNENASMEQKISLFNRAVGAHSSRAGRLPMDFYIPLIGDPRSDLAGSSSAGAEMLAPVFPGGRAEYGIDPGGGGGYVNLYDANGALVAQVMHGDMSRTPGASANRTFSAQQNSPTQQANSGATQRSYNEAYQRAMGTMDGSHYIGPRFEQVILQRLREGGVPQSRIDQVRQEIQSFNRGLPAEEQRRAQQLMQQGKDPNYFDQLPVDNLFDARDAASSGRLPREVQNNSQSSSPAQREQAMSEGEREHVHAAARQVDPEVARTTRQAESYSVASAAVATRQVVEERTSQQLTISRRRNSHPDDQIAVAEPGQRAPQHTQQEIQRVAYVEPRRTPTGQSYTHLTVEDQISEADRSAVMANDGRRLPDPQLAMAEPYLA